METIGDRIRELRGKLTQPEFAELIGSSPATIGRYERSITFVDSETIMRICDHFKVDPNWLLTGNSGGVIQRSHPEIEQVKLITAASDLIIQLKAEKYQDAQIMKILDIAKAAV